MKRKIVTLCGSTRFKDYFMEYNRLFTMEGAVVLMPGVFGHMGDPVNEKEKQALDELHRDKIKMSDAIFVVNINHYIGDSTRNEIEYAKSLNKPILYAEEGEI